MNNEERNIELIERYLEGELSPGELGEFEQRLKNEPGLDEEIEVFKILTNGIRYSGGISWRNSKPVCPMSQVKMSKVKKKRRRWFPCGGIEWLLLLQPRF